MHKQSYVRTLARSTMYVLAVILPLVFTIHTDELFEFPKMLLVYMSASVLLGCFLYESTERGRLSLPKTIFDIPIAVFFLSQFLSTIFSLHPHTSFFGYYSRFNGGLLSTISYIVIFYTSVFFLEKKHIHQLLNALLFGGILSALYAFPEHFGHSPSCLFVTGTWTVDCWVQDVQNRVFGTIGQPNWLAAYLLVLTPFALQKAVTSLSARLYARSLFWHSVVALFVSVILYTKSRSGILGLALALGLWVLLSIRQLGARRLFPALILCLVCCALIPNPLTDRIAPYIFHQKIERKNSAAVVTSGTQLETGGSESGDIRKVVWQGAIAVWKRYPFFGSGVETFAFAYYQDRPVAHNLLSEWDYLYNKAHNEFLNYLATTGAFGFLAYVLLIGSFVSVPLYWYRTNEAEPIFVAISCALLGLSASNFFGFSTVGVSMLTFLLPALAVVYGQNQGSTRDISLHMQSSSLRSFFLFCVVILVCTLLIQTIAIYTTDIMFAQGKSLISQSKIDAGIQSLKRATESSPNEPVYRDEYAYTLARIANALEQTGSSTDAAFFAQNAIEQSELVTSQNPWNVNFFKTKARIYTLLGEISPEFFVKATDALMFAKKLSPTDPKITYNLALLAKITGNEQDHVRYLLETVALRPIDRVARGDLALVYEQSGKKDLALQQYLEILRQDPTNPLASTRSASLSGIIQK